MVIRQPPNPCHWTPLQSWQSPVTKPVVQGVPEGFLQLRKWQPPQAGTIGIALGQIPFNIFCASWASTLGSRIEVPVRLFFFGFFPRPVCLIWVYVFNSFSKKSIACVLIWDMCAYQRQFFQNFAKCIQQQSTKKPINNDDHVVNECSNQYNENMQQVFKLIHE